ncbi:YccF domain-containing protein [Undibacterium sp. JH2W]|uniref:YccF domain-containing protein n=1 Tax=Undibacterium sp. JH2W TaxID=3413037 RepID=UPI003BF3A960
MSLLGNILWLICGGFLTGLAWWLAGLIAFLSIIGIPWGRACFVIGQLSFMPFGKEVVDRADISGQEDLGTGALGMIGNIIWFIFAGLWLAIAHLLSALFCFVTIIGIPFGIQHLKLAAIAAAPIGKAVIDK